MSGDKSSKAEQIVRDSGNTFHSKVLKYLHKKGWTVLISPYYTDNITSKPREIDLIAEKAFPMRDRHNQLHGNVNIKLFIECKYISKVTVFWFHDKDKQKAEGLVVHTTHLPDNNLHTNEHHYLDKANKVAKLFATEGRNSSDKEIFYKALNQSLHAMVYYRDGESIIELPNGRYYDTLRTVNYPVIVCNSFQNLFGVEIGENATPISIDDNFLLELNYAYMNSDGDNINEYFLIDVLDFNLFDSYLEKIEHDANIIGFFETH